MPTENRSSNTEMVSVQREPLERIDRMHTDGMSVYGECEEIRAILAKPAEQHQGEPVHMVRSHGSCCWEEMSGEILECCTAMPDEYEVRKLYTHADAGEVERLRAEVKRLDLLVAQADYNYDSDRANFKRQLAERDQLLGSAKSALCHLLHNIKISGKRIDLGLAKDSADTVITLINALQAEAKS